MNSKFLIRIWKKKKQRHFDKSGFFFIWKAPFWRGREKNLNHDGMYFSTSDIINELLHAVSRCSTAIQTAEMTPIAKVDYIFLTEEIAFLSCFAYFSLSPEDATFAIYFSLNQFLFIYFIQIQKISLLWRNLALILEYQLNILIA